MKLVQLVNQDPKVWLVEMVTVESQVLLVPREPLVMLGLVENKVLSEKLEREVWLEIQVVAENADQVVTQERSAQMERLAAKVHRANLAPMDHKDKMDPLAREESLVMLDNKDNQVQPERGVW